MNDLSELNKKYFIDQKRYNCPFCNMSAVVYEVVGNFAFDWKDSEQAFGYIVECGGCGKKSLHLSHFNWDCFKSYARKRVSNPFEYPPDNIKQEYRDSHNPSLFIDKYFFYHHPTSFFTLDERIPYVIRELIAEADGCRKMNWLVGASGALRKAIYKFLKNQGAHKIKNTKDVTLSYEDQIKWVKDKHSLVAGEYFTALSQIQGMTSEELHEDKDWEPWTREEFDFLVATVKAVVHEVYVVPEERKSMLAKVLKLGPEKKQISQQMPSK